MVMGGQQGGGGDLFSEIHMSEIKKFEELLAEAETDRDAVKELNVKLQAQLDEAAAKMAGEAAGELIS